MIDSAMFLTGNHVSWHPSEQYCRLRPNAPTQMLEHLGRVGPSCVGTDLLT